MPIPMPIRAVPANSPVNPMRFLSSSPAIIDAMAMHMVLL